MKSNSPKRPELKPTQFPTRDSPVDLDTSQIKQELTLCTKPVTLHAASVPILSRGQKGDPHLEPPSLSLYSAGIASPDQRVAAGLQHRLHPTMSRGRWYCRCYCCCCYRCYFFFFFFFNLTYSRWTSSLPSCRWSLRIFPSLPGSRLTIFYRDASSALLQLVNQWLNSTVMLQPPAVVVVDLQQTHGTGIKGVGGCPPLAADFASGPNC